MSLPRAALAGAIGFAVGLFLAGLLGDLMLLGFFLGAAIGAGALGFAERGRVSGPFAMAGAGGIGGGAGFFLAFLVVLTLWEPTLVGDFGEMMFVGAVGGALLGLGLSIPLRSARAAGVLALAGAIGFGAGFVALEVVPSPGYEACCTMEQSLRVAAPLAVAGAVGGAVLGVAFDAVIPPAGVREARMAAAKARPRGAQR